MDGVCGVHMVMLRAEARRAGVEQAKMVRATGNRDDTA